MSETPKKTFLQKAQSYVEKLGDGTRDNSNNFNGMLPTIIAMGLTIVAILFPPWVAYLTRNGVTVKLDGGHHFILKGRPLMDIDYKMLLIQLSLIWLIYGVYFVISKATKK